MENLTAVVHMSQMNTLQLTNNTLAITNSHFYKENQSPRNLFSSMTYTDSLPKLFSKSFIKASQKSISSDFEIAKFMKIFGEEIDAKLNRLPIDSSFTKEEKEKYRNRYKTIVKKICHLKKLRWLKKRLEFIANQPNGMDTLTEIIQKNDSPTEASRAILRKMNQNYRIYKSQKDNFNCELTHNLLKGLFSSNEKYKNFKATCPNESLFSNGNCSGTGVQLTLKPRKMRVLQKNKDLFFEKINLQFEGRRNEVQNSTLDCEHAEIALRNDILQIITEMANSTASDPKTSGPRFHLK